jgi:DNA-binding NarL/FixJ family response regulator
MNRPRVLLADDHRMVTEGLKRLLADDFELVGAVEDGHALLAAAKKLSPDVIVADITMPQLNGIDALHLLKKHNPEVKVVFLTMHQDRAYARRAMEAGAAGFVVKHAASDELVMAIHAALKGKMFIAPALAGDVLNDIQHSANEERNAKGSITPRQREILQLLAEGRSAKEIAQILSISARTVEFHKYQMMETHEFHSSAELVHYAIKRGIVTI